MQKSIQESGTRAYLMKKLLTVCPVCKKLIYGKDIDLDHVHKLGSYAWPVKYLHDHTYNTHSKHSITMFLDANLSVRNIEVSE